MRKLFSLLISSNTDLPKDSLLVKLQWQETKAVDQTLILRHQKRLRQMLLVKGGEELRATFLLKRPSSFGRGSQDKLIYPQLLFYRTCNLPRQISCSL